MLEVALAQGRIQNDYRLYRQQQLQQLVALRRDDMGT